ncbi:MAG: phosphotransferase family protein [Propionibacteriales bacterium]|nr:phosphotransferase family protein [Propionibacteriales bacterium]
MIEGASDVRAEDAFDVEAVRDWLAAQGHPLTGDVAVRQFGGGASNLTYSLRTEQDDLILRRPPAGQKAKGAHDMAREFRIQAGLAEVFPLVPAMVALCQDESVIGSEFYVMQRIDGIIPRRDLPPDVHLTEEQTRALCTRALDVLIDLHRVDVDATPLASMNKGDGYVRRQVDGWSTRFRNARTDDAPDCETVMAWLAEHQPPDVGHCLIHNDFRFDNLVLDRDDPTRPIGVLDWEMATVGDPLMDLGGTLSYWVQDDDDEFFRQFRRQPTQLPGMLSREQVVAYYCDATGRSLSERQWQFYEVFGLFRLAVIAQQIYYRYFHRQTTNESYAIFGPATHYLVSRCRGIIGTA